MYARHKFTRIAITLIAITLLLAVAFYYYRRNYTYPKSGDDYLLYLNPFQPDQSTFNQDYVQVQKALKKGDAAKAISLSKKALTYRGTFNERQYNRIFSDDNDYQQYKLTQIIRYANLYELTGLPDSAMSCLSEGLILHDRWDFPLEKYFFTLAIKKYGRNQIRNMIAKGLDNIRSLDNYNSSEFYYSFDHFKLGLNESDALLARTDKVSLLESLYKKYGL